MTKPRIHVRTKNPTITLSDPASKNETNRQSAERGRDSGRRGGGTSPSPEPGSPNWKSSLVWVLKEDDEGEPIGWGSPYSGGKWGKGGRNKRVGSVAISVVGAVLLGTLLGGLIMNLFFSENQDFSSRSIDSHLQRSPGDATKSKSEVREEKQEAKKEKPAPSFRLPGLQAVLVQGGNFKERDGALQTVRKYRSEGQAAVTTEDSPYRIYRGVGLDKGGSRQLMDVLAGENLKSYPKAVQVGDKPVPLSALADKKSGEKLSTWVNHGHQVFRVMVEKTVEGLGPGKKDVSFEKAWNDVLKHYNNLVQTAPGLEKEIPADAKPHLAQMVRAMDQVVQSGRSNPKQLEIASLWQMQEGLIRYALAYEKFVEALR